MKRFVIGVENMTKEEDNLFMEFIRGRKAGWWHWMNGFWLITHANDDLSAAELRDTIRRIAKGKTCIVLDIASTTGYQGYGPSSPGNDMFKWLTETWIGQTAIEKK